MQSQRGIAPSIDVLPEEQAGVFEFDIFAGLGQDTTGAATASDDAAFRSLITDIIRDPVGRGTAAPTPGRFAEPSREATPETFKPATTAYGGSQVNWVPIVAVGGGLLVAGTLLAVALRSRPLTGNRRRRRRRR